jgi:tetratricopeptide (TPR) repeat protein
MSSIDRVDQLRRQWTKCMQSKNYAEAVLLLSDAIALKPDLYDAYEQRSLAFEHLQQYYLSLEDAKQLINLNPRLARSHLRKAEIESVTENFNDAIATYKAMGQLALPMSPELSARIRQCKLRLLRQQTSDRQLIWVGAAVGLLVGIVLVTLDFVHYTVNGYLSHPAVKVLAITGSAFVFFYLASVHRRYAIRARTDLILPPPELHLDIKLE